MIEPAATRTDFNLLLLLFDLLLMWGFYLVLDADLEGAVVEGIHGWAPQHTNEGAHHLSGKQRLWGCQCVIPCPEILRAHGQQILAVAR